jgi:hypothetical protein
LTECIEGHTYGLRVQLGLERKVVELGLLFQQFEFDIATERAKEMIGLGRDRVRGRPFEETVQWTV